MSPSAAAARWAVLGAAALFSTGGAAIKGTALDALQVAGFRSGVAALAILLLLPGARRAPRWEHVPAAFAYAATLVCFVAATKLTTSAAAIFLQSTAPIWVLVLAPLLLAEPMRRRDLPFVALAAAGLALVFFGSHSPLATAPDPVTGNLVALASGLFYALLMISLRRLARAGPEEDRSLTAAVLGNALAFAGCLPLALPVERLSTADLLTLVYLGVIQIGLAYALLVRGIRRLSALEVSLLLLLEPLLNPLWTWWLHGETPSWLASAGGAVLLVALVARIVLVRPLPQVAAPPAD